jgi:hypothetical protein
MTRVSRSLLLSFFFVVLIFANGTAQSTQTPAKSNLNARPIEIPFELISKHIFLKIKVDNSRPLTFIFDTGDQVAIIDMARARELGLRLEGELKVGGVGPNKLTGAYVRGSSFTVPGLEGFSQPVRIALPLAGMAPKIGHDIDGIIGSEFIRQFVVEVDYQANVIRLHDKDTFVYSGNGQTIPISLNSAGYPILEAEVTPEGDEPVKGKFVLDLGAGGTLALHSPFVAARNLPRPETKTIPVQGVGGAGGEATGRFGRVASLKIGRFTFDRPLTLFSQDKAGAAANPALAGNIGYQIASRFKLFLDYGHQQIYFEPNARISEKFERAISGIQLQAEGANYQTFRIRNILDNSPAAEAGLQQEDIIEAVDAIPASKLTVSKIADIFERSGTYNLTVRRGEQLLQVQLKTRQMI